MILENFCIFDEFGNATKFHSFNFKLILDSILINKYQMNSTQSREDIKGIWPEGQYSDIEIDAFIYQNQIRENPSIAVNDLQEMLTWFEGGSNTYYRPGSSCGMMTNEGPAAIEDAIQYLQNV